MKSLNDVIVAAESGEVDYVIARDGQPVAVIVGHDRYESLLETLDILSDPDAMEAIGDGLCEGET